MAKRSMRVILNGKVADTPQVRSTIEKGRREGHDIQVRLTWEKGDAAAFAAEAMQLGIDAVVAGGGDGTVHEVVNGLFKVTHKPSIALGILPLGSANDFARGCGITPRNPLKALRFAATAEPRMIDVGRINDIYFVNACIIGFGAEVTFNTSDRMKKAIRGAAYGITGFLTALKRNVYKGTVKTAQGTEKRRIVFSAISNAGQAGGVQVAPRAKLNDGLLDRFIVPDFSLDDLPVIMRDIKGLKSGREPQIVHYEQLEWMEVKSDKAIPISPDGERLETKQVRAEVIKRSLPCILPDGPLLD